MNNIIEEWFLVIRWGGFWGLWVGYFLIYKGIDKGWANRHTAWWWIFVIATYVFYIVFQPYLDWNVPGPNPTPCLFAIFLIGILIGRYVIPKRSNES